jgi:ectoine hydroxylase-related dioxygenase (phytanoyl-CoA dioxygenase family)
MSAGLLDSGFGSNRAARGDYPRGRWPNPIVREIEVGPFQLSPSQTAFFEANGYLQLDRIVDLNEVERLKGRLQALFATKAGCKEGAQFDLVGSSDGAMQQALPQIINPSNYARDLLRANFFTTASEIANQLLGPRARFADDHVLMKPPRVGAATPWHQDEAFRDPEYETREISIWLALQAVNRHNGCMEFIPGSNLGDVLPHRSPNGDGSVHALECYDGFDPNAAVPCSLPAGGCTIHTGRTLHFAGPNLSDLPRYAYVLIFNLPPVAARQVREFPWLAQRQTQHDERNRRWRSRGGFAVEAMRWVRKLDLGDIERLSYDVRRAGTAVARAFRR